MASGRGRGVGASRSEGASVSSAYPDVKPVSLSRSFRLRTSPITNST